MIKYQYKDILQLIEYYFENKNMTMETITLNLSEILSNQAIHNIGSIGHVSNGKSTLVKALTGIKTQKFEKEKERNITIHLGYANSKIYFSEEDNTYHFSPSNTKEFLHPETGKPLKLVYHISLADCPGHESYMATMLSGASIMNSCILIEAANAPIVPQPQTYEHLMAVQYTELKNILIVQNKIDLVSRREAQKNYEKIQDFVEDTIAHNSTIIPISAQLGTNIGHVGRWIATQTNTDIERLNVLINQSFKMSIIRSFDINKPHMPIESLSGGVIGGSIEKGILNVGDLLEIRPGILKKTERGWISNPLICNVLSINTEKNKMDYAIPGGLIGIGTTLDPAFCKADKLIGQVAGQFGTLPNLYSKITFGLTFINRLEGNKEIKYQSNEKVMLCNNSEIVNGVIISSKKESSEVVIQTDKPIVISDSSKVSILRKINGVFKLFAVGKTLKLDVPAEIIYLEDYEKETERENKKYVINDDINHIPIIESDWSYSQFWTDDIKKVEIHKFSIPFPEIKPEGKLTQWNNYSDIIDYMTKLQEDTFMKNHEVLPPSVLKLFLKEYICKDLNCEININESGNCILTGKFKPPAIQSTLAGWATKYLSCPVCKSCYSYINRENRLMFKNCIDCKAITSILH